MEIRAEDALATATRRTFLKGAGGLLVATVAGLPSFARAEEKETGTAVGALYPRLRFLASDPAFLYSRPCFSPSGDRVLFMRAPLRSDRVTEINSDATPWGLWSVSAMGGSPRRLFEDPSLHATRPDWSWSSGRIAFTGIRGNRATLWILAADDGQAHEVEVGDPPGTRIYYPSWYAHGRALTVTDWATHRLLRVDLEAGRNEPLTDPARIQAGMSSACPDSRREFPIAFAGQPAGPDYESRRNTIWILDGASDPFPLDGEHGRMPAWSPGGDRLAFQSLRARPAPAWRIHPRMLRGGRTAIHITERPMRGAMVRSVAVTPHDHVTSHAKWSPDGFRLVCTAYSSRTGERGVAIVDLYASTSRAPGASEARRHD